MSQHDRLKIIFKWLCYIYPSFSTVLASINLSCCVITKSNTSAHLVLKRSVLFVSILGILAGRTCMTATTMSVTVLVDDCVWTLLIWGSLTLWMVIFTITRNTACTRVVHLCYKIFKFVVVGGKFLQSLKYVSGCISGEIHSIWRNIITVRFRLLLFQLI